MNRLLSAIGLLCTVAYLTSLFVLFNGRWAEIASMSPNNVGDFLAGAFGPLAILWLVLGFFQQGVELRQNTQALERQAEELRLSVEQQRDLVNVSREQLKVEQDARRAEQERHLAAFAPNLYFGLIGTSHIADKVRYHFRVVNTGAAASKVAIEAVGAAAELTESSFQGFEAGGGREIYISYGTGHPTAADHLVLSYADALGARYSKRYEYRFYTNGLVYECVATEA